MPKAIHSTSNNNNQRKRRGRPPILNAEGERKNPPRSKKQITPEKYINSDVRHYYDKVYQTITPTEERKIEKPENLIQHWTNNPHHSNWLRYWHLHQQITALENKFFETADWSLFDIINNYQRVKYELVVNGKNLHYEEREILETRYATHQPHQLKNQIPSIQNTFYNNTQPNNSIYIYPPPSEPISEITSESDYIQDLKEEPTPSPSCY
jgi:hypothetical protein